MIRRGVPFRDIVRTQSPLLSPDPARPVLFTVELTNYCNLGCNYCTNRLVLRERGFIADDTFAAVADGVRRLGINRVRVVGGGEPTLHQHFARFVRELAAATPYLSVLSNGQWKRPLRTVRAMLEAPVDLIEVSVEGADADRYRESTGRGSFARLLDNLSLLKREKENSGLKSIVNLRIMVRPSDRGREKELRAFWKRYGDTTMIQRLVELKGVEAGGDLYRPVQFDDQSFPVCSLPFKAMEVNWNGNVPLCYNSLAQYGPPGYILGNVNDIGLPEIWNGEVLRAYRRAHHKRLTEDMPICKGCTAV
jgi:MoaA/NifB/PqqE/SkfB family radical SAM enzyme